MLTQSEEDIGEVCSVIPSPQAVSGIVGILFSLYQWSDDGSASRCHPRSHKVLGVKTKYLNQGADILSSQGLGPGEWRLHTETVELIRSSATQMWTSFESEECIHCPLLFSLRHSVLLGRDALVQIWPRLCLHTFPLTTLLPVTLQRIWPLRGINSWTLNWGCWDHP